MKDYQYFAIIKRFKIFEISASNISNKDECLFCKRSVYFRFDHQNRLID